MALATFDKVNNSELKCINFLLFKLHLNNVSFSSLCEWSLAGEDLNQRSGWYTSNRNRSERELSVLYSDQKLISWQKPCLMTALWVSRALVKQVCLRSSSWRNNFGEVEAFLEMERSLKPWPSWPLLLYSNDLHCYFIELVPNWLLGECIKIPSCWGSPLLSPLAISKFRKRIV